VVNLVCEAILPDCPMKDVEEIEKSIVTTYKKSIWSKFLKAISDFDMIQDGDKIAIGVSGGKDSLLLVKLFQELKKDRRKNFEFKAVSLNPGFRNSDLDNFKNKLNINYIFKGDRWILNEYNYKNDEKTCKYNSGSFLYVIKGSTICFVINDKALRALDVINLNESELVFKYNDEFKRIMRLQMQEQNSLELSGYTIDDILNVTITYRR